VDQTHHPQRQDHQQVSPQETERGLGEIPGKSRQCERGSEGARGTQICVIALVTIRGGGGGGSDDSFFETIGRLVGRVARPPARLGFLATLALAALIATGTLTATDAGVGTEFLVALSASLFLGKHAPKLRRRTEAADEKPVLVL
jgi:hypothetical protein